MLFTHSSIAAQAAQAHPSQPSLAQRSRPASAAQPSGRTACSWPTSPAQPNQCSAAVRPDGLQPAIQPCRPTHGELTAGESAVGEPTAGSVPQRNPPLGAYRSRVTGHRSQVTGHGSRVTGHRSQVTGHGSQVTGHRSQVTSHRSQRTSALFFYRHTPIRSAREEFALKGASA